MNTYVTCEAVSNGTVVRYHVLEKRMVKSRSVASPTDRALLEYLNAFVMTALKKETEGEDWDPAAAKPLRDLEKKFKEMTDKAAAGGAPYEITVFVPKAVFYAPTDLTGIQDAIHEAQHHWTCLKEMIRNGDHVHAEYDVVGGLPVIGAPTMAFRVDDPLPPGMQAGPLPAGGFAAPTPPDISGTP